MSGQTIADFFGSTRYERLVEKGERMCVFGVAAKDMSREDLLAAMIFLWELHNPPKWIGILKGIEP